MPVPERESAEASGRGEPRQPRGWWAAADTLTAVRIPLAIAFVLVADAGWRTAILAVGSASDLLDGIVARRWGSSRLGPFLDPVADKLFVACGFGVVLAEGGLTLLETLAVLLRDVVAAVAFVVVALRRRATAIPARLGGKVVTVGQLLTLLAFLVESPLLRPAAWVTAGMGLYAVWDYQRVAPREARALGE